MAIIVTGEKYYGLDGQLSEIKRQLRQPSGYPYDPDRLSRALQEIIEGKFGDEQAPLVVAPQQFRFPAIVKASESDLDQWLKHAEKFAKKHFKVTVDLRKQFDIPEMLPWKSVIPIYDPGTLTNRGMFTLLNDLGLNPWEETDVMRYAGAEATGKPTLHFIANSEKPDADTLTDPGTSPDQLRATGKPYLRLRGYGLAFGVYHFATKGYPDPETWTWFPEDRLPDGSVALGDWYRSGQQVKFHWCGPGYRNPDIGARLAMAVSPKP